MDKHNNNDYCGTKQQQLRKIDVLPAAQSMHMHTLCGMCVNVCDDKQYYFDFIKLSC